MRAPWLALSTTTVDPTIARAAGKAPLGTPYE